MTVVSTSMQIECKNVNFFPIFLVSGTRKFVVDPWGLVCWWVGHSWVGFVLGCPTNAQSDWDLGMWRPTQHHVLFVFLKPFLSSFCDVSGCPAAIGAVAERF